MRVLAQARADPLIQSADGNHAADGGGGASPSSFRARTVARCPGQEDEVLHALRTCVELGTDGNVVTTVARPQCTGPFSGA